MRDRLTRREGWISVGMILILALASVWQSRQLRAVQLEEEKALYAERLRTAQVIVENEMLAAASLTAPDARTRERARVYLDGSPW
jgi:hypothetical protein